MKRKLTAVILAAALAASLAACGGSEAAAPAASSEEEVVEEAKEVKEEAAEAVEEAEEEVEEEVEEAAEEETAGFYRLIEMEQAGEVTGLDEIEAIESIGMIIYLELDPDGSAKINMMGDEVTGSWKEGSITLEGETVDLVREGDIVIISEDDTIMTFERTTKEYIESVNGALSEGSDSSESSSNADKEVKVIEDGIIVDNDSCRIEITGYEPNGDYGATLYVTCENKTEDQKLTFSTIEGAVNGYMLDPGLFASVTAGSIDNTEVTYYYDDLAEIGITEPDEVLWELWVYDADNYGLDPCYEGTIAYYPTGKSADEVTPPERKIGEKETVLVDNDDVTMIIYGTETDNWDYMLKAYIENKKDYPIMVSWDDCSVNGVMVDPFWATVVLPGKRSYNDIGFSLSDLEENEIELDAISEIKGRMTIYNDDDWMADYLIDEDFVVNP